MSTPIVLVDVGGWRKQFVIPNAAAPPEWRVPVAPPMTFILAEPEPAMQTTTTLVAVFQRTDDIEDGCRVYRRRG